MKTARKRNNLAGPDRSNPCSCKRRGNKDMGVNVEHRSNQKNWTNFGSKTKSGQHGGSGGKAVQRAGGANGDRFQEKQLSPMGIVTQRVITMKSGSQHTIAKRGSCPTIITTTKPNCPPEKLPCGNPKSATKAKRTRLPELKKKAENRAKAR